MNSYPELDGKNKEKGISVTPSNNSSNIKNTYDSMREKSNIVINNALTKKIKSIKAEIQKIPEIYKNLRNNLTTSNNKVKKDMEEHIANTGNHTASGYAISKRMDNQNEYLKALNDVDKAEKDKISELNDKLREAYDDAQAESIKASQEHDYKELQDILKESERVDKLNFDTAKYNADYQLDYDKLSEEKRLNDSKISKTESDIKLAEDENRRENEKHSLEMEYEPQLYKAKISKTNAEAAKAYKTSSSASSGSSKAEVTSKMSAKDIAESIRKQAGITLIDERGKEYIKVDDFKAYTFLISWKNKFGLSNQVVNDAAIYLGIQGYL